MKSNATESVDLNNTEVAYARLSNSDLQRSYQVFKLLKWRQLSIAAPKVIAMLLNLGLPIRRLVQNSIFYQFCGGETIGDSEPRLKKLFDSQITSILDFAKEGIQSEQEFDQTVAEILSNIDFAQSSQMISFCVFKPTALALTSVLEKQNSGEKLSEQESRHMQRVEQRFETIASHAAKCQVKILVDAEESWLQDPIDRIIENLMARFNQQNPIVFQTIQLYRNDKLSYLQNLLAKSQEEKWILGVKLVRGAYLETEWQRSIDSSGPCKVFRCKNQTDEAFNAGLDLCLENLDSLSLCLGTHNQQSVERAVMKLQEISRDPSKERVHFAQLLGMSDNLSFNLANSGFLVSKYVPYGPVDKLLPYLSRRMEENSSVSGQTGRELTLIREELARRRSLSKKVRF